MIKQYLSKKNYSRGVKQKEGAIRQLEDNLYEMSKSLTRTVDDVDRDAMLKNQVNMVAIFMIFDNNDIWFISLRLF